MPYEAQLQMLCEVYRKCRIQALVLDPDAPLDERVDMGLRRLLGTDDTDGSFRDFAGELHTNTIYALTDALGCRYSYLLLPRGEVLVIGPSLPQRLSQQQMMENAEHGGVPPRLLKALEAYYGDLPLLSEQSHLHALLDTFAEHLWGVGNYTAIDLEREDGSPLSPLEERTSTLPENDGSWSMLLMERRYEYENELMQAVTSGQIHKIDLLLSNLSEIPFERRLTDTVRNTKNYCIIMNTLLRKAAENGGVHPIHLDSISSDFARKIEQLTSTAAGMELMSEAFRRYCLLVRDHAIGKYSALIRRTIAYIESDLTADLSLRRLAAIQNVSSSYLSALFSKEAGMTLTEYVNDKRIKCAKQLLRTTKLQIQTVAQHCGILDVYYFSKLFKKNTGQTPREYRESTANRSIPRKGNRDS